MKEVVHGWLGLGGDLVIGSSGYEEVTACLVDSGKDRFQGNGNATSVGVCQPYVLNPG